MSDWKISKRIALGSKGLSVKDGLATSTFACTSNVIAQRQLILPIHSSAARDQEDEVNGKRISAEDYSIGSLSYRQVSPRASGTQELGGGVTRDR